MGIQIKDHFHSAPKDLLSIITDKGGHFIPDMQRNYQWRASGGAEIDVLWKALIDYHDIDSAHEDVYYTGTMIVYSESGSGLKWGVIDGQQRLITFSLLFMALRDVIEEVCFKGSLRDKKFKFLRKKPLYVIEDIPELIQNKLLGTSKDPLLEPKEDNRNSKRFQFYRNKSKRQRDQDQEKMYQKLLTSKAYNYFVNKLGGFNSESKEGLQNLLDFVQHILRGVVINRVTVKSLAKGYRIFSTENTTGLKLNNLDIVRALTMAHVDRRSLGQPVQDALSGNFSLINVRLDSDNSGILNTFVRHCWIMKEGRPLPPTKLLDCISTEIDEIKSSDTDMIQFGHQLQRSAGKYGMRLLDFDDTKDPWAHGAIMNLTKQYWPFYLSLMRRGGMKNQLKQHQLRPFINIVEILYVRLQLTLDVKGSALEPFYAAWAKRGEDSGWEINELYKAMLEEAKELDKKKTDELQATIGAMMGKARASPKKALYLLKRLELIDAKKPDLEELQKKLDGSRAERILLKPSKNENTYADWAKDHWNDIITENREDMLANWVLVPKGFKRKKGDFNTFVAQLSNEGVFKSTLRFADHHDRWDPVTQGARADEIGKKALQIWSFDGELIKDELPSD